MAKVILFGRVEGVMPLVSREGKTYGYQLGLSIEFKNKYGQIEKQITDIRYSDKTRMAVENAVRDLVGKDVYVECWVRGDTYNGKTRVEYNYQIDTPIIDASKADPFGQARIKAA